MECKCCIRRLHSMHFYTSGSVPLSFGSSKPALRSILLSVILHWYDELWCRYFVGRSKSYSSRHLTSGFCTSRQKLYIRTKISFKTSLYFGNTFDISKITFEENQKIPFPYTVLHRRRPRPRSSTFLNNCHDENWVIKSKCHNPNWIWLSRKDMVGMQRMKKAFDHILCG